MLLFQTYQNVNIYLDPDKGQFYCDMDGSKKTPSKKSTHFETLVQMKDYIDESVNNNTIGKNYYRFLYYEKNIQLLTVIKVRGNTLYFQDGTSTKDYNRGALYDEVITETVEFKVIENLLKNIKEKEQNIDVITEEINEIRKEISQNLEKFQLIYF